eukprot:TRINITY_DN8409_c0_g7_i1.p1 TRINITY_DN8409_c0_g7~~TRINITY_DN8409_c0_g7_i1.p1  ORF type:complete len:180 (+),score=30.74 TRINITY_DN8409_c0_g7_i1:153-692(+)
MTDKKSPAHSAPKLDNSEGEGLSTVRRKYVPVNYDTRKELLKIISDENLTIKAAAARLGINYSNAKNIAKIYKKERRIEKLPKKPNLTLKEITSPFYSKNSIPLRAALLPFYDANEAQQFLNWKKTKDMEQWQQANSNQSTRSGLDMAGKVLAEERKGSAFNFEAYRIAITDRFSLKLN